MPTYAPQDMAYILRMTKPSGKMTKDEMDLMRNVAGAIEPMGARPVDMPQMATPAPMPQAMPQAMPQGQPVNRLAQIQAAANQVLAGGENPEGQRMANMAKYFQGRQ